MAGAICSYLGLILYELGGYLAPLEYHNKALAIKEELQDKVGMAHDYYNMGLVLKNIKNHKAGAMEAFSKALATLEEHEESFLA